MYGRLRRLLRSNKHRLPDSLRIGVADRQLQFDTQSAIAKRWFYPRYASGTPHEPPIVQWLIERFTGDTLFLDVGANVGFYSMLASEFCLTGRVIALEIDPTLVAEIRNNVLVNKFDNTEVICGGAWERDGDVLGFEP